MTTEHARHMPKLTLEPVYSSDFRNVFCLNCPSLFNIFVELPVHSAPPRHRAFSPADEVGWGGYGDVCRDSHHTVPTVQFYIRNFPQDRL
ncbi:hypothetical protein EVAR_13168_1 [Eumeta japonica]|uniref:Uncharacterized protein n=1 Tax=Eumeta variegata TaxID=151549 RepID=A0A4C1UAQ0_EUMVA|nr:hypothetical protein EVAR_13168_1 [Eumeta japonica]